MSYDRQFGKLLVEKYLGTPELLKRKQHSQGVGEFAFKVATRIRDQNPELSLDPETVGFLGYVHDIGYSIAAEKHEVHTVDLLLREGVPPRLASRTMHGQLMEQFGPKEGNITKYLPRGLHGMIVTYSDMSVRLGDPVTLRERAAEIIERMNESSLPEHTKREIEENMYKALPRFERYERIILNLANVASAKEF